MRSNLSRFARVFTLFGLLFLPASAFAQIPPAPQTIPSHFEIPAATAECAPEVCQWWEKLRQAGRTATAAQLRKEEAFKADAELRYQTNNKKFLLSDDDRAKLTDDVVHTGRDYLAVLHSAPGDSPRIPLTDSKLRPVVVRRIKALYTEEARQNKIQGNVLLSAVFQADGTVSTLRVVRGLPDGLTETAIEAAKQILFLPAVKDGTFVSVRLNIEFSFSLY